MYKLKDIKGFSIEHDDESQKFTISMRDECCCIDQEMDTDIKIYKDLESLGADELMEGTFSIEMDSETTEEQIRALMERYGIPEKPSFDNGYDGEEEL